MRTLQEKLMKMVGLQETDNKIAENRKILKMLERQKSKLEQELEDLRLHEMELEQKLKETNRQSKVMEHELQDFEARFKKEQQKLLTVSNIKEMKAVQSEIENLLNRKKEHEEKIFNLLVTVEDLQSKLEAVTQESKQETKAIEQQIQTNRGRTERVEQEYVDLQENRAQRADLLDDDLLQLYETLHREKGGKAIVVVTDYTCKGCYLDLPRGTINEIRSNAKLTECINCGRLLYWDGEDR